MMAMASWCARAMRSSSIFYLTRSFPAVSSKSMQLRPPTMTSTPSINISSDLMEDRCECSRLSRAGPTVVEGATLATLWQPDLHPCAQRSSPEPVYAPQNLDLSARFDSRAHHPSSRDLGQKRTRGPGPNRERYTSPRGNRPAVLSPSGYLLRLHGGLYVAIPWRDRGTHSSLSISRPGQKRSPGGRKVSCRRGRCHCTVRNSRPCLRFPHV